MLRNECDAYSLAYIHNPIIVVGIDDSRIENSDPIICPEIDDCKLIDCKYGLAKDSFDCDICKCYNPCEVSFVSRVSSGNYNIAYKL